MPLTARVDVPYAMKMTVVKIYSYESKNLKGILISSYFSEEQKFESTMDMLLLLETIFDNTLPQSTFDSRSFDKIKNKEKLKLRAACGARERDDVTYI